MKVKKSVPAIQGRYRHQNGYTYSVEGIYREEDLGVWFVAHRGEHDGRRWVRSVKNFLGVKNGKPRFVPV